MREQPLGSIGPLQARNPFLLRPKAGLLGFTSLPAHEIYKTTDFSTTNTADFLAVVSGVIRTFGGRAALIVSAMFGARHSAPPAGLDCRIDIYVGRTIASGGVTIVRRVDVLIDNATFWTPVSLFSLIDLRLNDIPPGEHLFELVMKNKTAGTLTVRGDDIGLLLDSVEIVHAQDAIGVLSS